MGLWAHGKWGGGVQKVGQSERVTTYRKSHFVTILFIGPKEMLYKLLKFNAVELSQKNK